MSSDDSDHEGGRGGMDFAAIDSQANVNLSLEEANKLHRQKLMALMRSNDVLRKELKQARKEGSDNYRVKQIKHLRQQLRETQSIADALTHQLMAKSGMSKDEVGELYDDILSQPKLAKPNNPVKLKKDVLILQNSTQALERELAATKKLLREYRSGERRLEADGEVFRPARAAAMPSDSAIAEELRQLRLQHEVALGEIETKSRVVALHRDMCAKLQAENRELQQLKLNWDDMERARQVAEQEAAQTREQMLRSMGHSEEYVQDIRELRTKLATLLQVRDKVEAQHEAKLNAMRQGVAKIQERELHLRGQIQMLKADLKAAQDAATHYKREASQGKAALEAAHKQTESDKVWELQTKLSVLSRELKEKSTDLRAAQAALKGSGRHASEAERALQERIAQLTHDNSRLSSTLDQVERRYITHNEEIARGHGERSALELKYNALLREMDERAARFQSNQQMNQDMQARLNAAEQAVQYHTEQAAQMQAQRQADLQRIETQENTLKQMQLALNERARFDGGATGGEVAAALASHRSHDSSSDDLFSNRGGGEKSNAALAAQLKRQEETHLEHVAKLMRNFEQKERDMLYQIARLQETIKPGSGNRTHLAYGQRSAAAAPARASAAAAQRKQPDPFESSDDDSDDSSIEL